MELKDRIVERLPKRKLIRYDLLPVITDRDLSKDIVNTLAEPYRGKIDMVVAPEAIGWILGNKVADHLGVDFLPLRRGNKLPYEEDDLYRVNFMDYQLKRKSLEITKDADLTGRKILICDEWIETGAQIKAVLSLLEKFDCEVKGIATIFIKNSERTRQWKEEGLLTYISEDL